MQAEEAIKRFERELRQAWGCADRTVAAYLGELAGFEKWLTTQGRTLLKVDRDVFLTWREEISQTRKPNGVSLAATALRSFYAILSDSGILTPNPFPETLKIRVKRQEPADVPTVQQFMQIREALERPVDHAGSTPVDIRRVVVELLAGSGMRIEAMLTLKPRHLRFGARPHILVEHDTMACKGKTAGEIPISPYVASLLKSHIEDHPRGFDDVLFDFSGSLVRKILHQVQPEGLHLKPHSLRHFYCSMCYFKNFDGGKNDILWVRDAAGHGNITTTNNYLKMARRVCQDEQSWDAWANGAAVAQEAISA